MDFSARVKCLWNTTCEARYFLQVYHALKFHAKYLKTFVAYTDSIFSFIFDVECEFSPLKYLWVHTDRTQSTQATH